MRSYLRLLRVIICALLRTKNHDITDESVLHFTVMPWDCVVRLAGNDRYNTFMDLGRVDLLIRLGGWRTLWHERLQPFVYSSHVQYRHPLRLFQSFVLRTRLVHWDNRFFWMEHVFQVGKQTMATAISKSGFTYGNRIITSEVIFCLLNGEKVRSNYPRQHIATVAAVENLLRWLHLKKKVLR